jgi:hypothetical protein
VPDLLSSFVSRSHPFLAIDQQRGRIWALWEVGDAAGKNANVISMKQDVEALGYDMAVHHSLLACTVQHPLMQAFSR